MEILQFIINVELNPLTANVPHHVETSQVICNASQWFLCDGELWSLMG